MDRCVLACEAEGIEPPHSLSLDLFIVPIGADAKKLALSLAESLRTSRLSVDIAFGDRSLKGGMKAADKSGARFSMVIGDEELSSDTALLKNMSSGEDHSVKISALHQEIDRYFAQTTGDR